MPRFAQFKAATKAQAPNLLDAEIARGKFEQQARAAKQKARTGTAVGAAKLYNDALGDENTPIQDYLSSVLRDGDSAMSNAPVTPAPISEAPYGEVPSEAVSYGTGVEAPIESGALSPTASELPLGFDTSTGAIDPALTGGAASELPLGFDTSTGAIDPALTGGADAASLSDALRGGEGVTNAVEGADAAAGSNIPVLSALQGANQLAQGDVAGAAGTGGKAWLASLGPYGIAAAMALGLFGV